MLDKINKRRNWCCLQYKNIWVQLSWYTGEFKRAHPCWCWWCWTEGNNWCCGMLANLLGYYFLYLKEWSTFHFYFIFKSELLLLISGCCFLSMCLLCSLSLSYMHISIDTNLLKVTGLPSIFNNQHRRCSFSGFHVVCVYMTFNGPTSLCSG